MEQFISLLDSKVRSLDSPKEKQALSVIVKNCPFLSALPSSFSVPEMETWLPVFTISETCARYASLLMTSIRGALKRPAYT
ncbi:hypothetical protein EON65_07555 [archaeon]|nr:MAG: hypothetical protein EON65_07555 [archaeon]